MRILATSFVQMAKTTRVQHGSGLVKHACISQCLHQSAFQPGIHLIQWISDNIVHCAGRLLQFVSQQARLAPGRIWITSYI